MSSRSLVLRRLVKPVLAAAFLLSALAPAHAAVTTVYSCAPSGHNGNHDAVYNGFFVQNVAADNLHTVVLYYTTDQSGTYTLALTAHRNSYTGPVIGTVTQSVALSSSSSDKTVTWNFGDAAITSGATLYFTQTQSGGGGTVNYNLQPHGTCPGSEESVGTSANLNQFNVAVTITQNTSSFTPCVANATTLCIDDQSGDKRFQVRVTYSTTQGGGLSGTGHAIPLTSLGVNRGGLFWFFGSDNPEMLIKILNGCSINNRFWVYYAAGTNVGFHVTVTDLKLGNAVSYSNTDLTQAPPVQDVGALACQ